jgi:ribonuclease J
MKLTIHRGANEIGGSCVEVVTQNTRILLDFGMPLGNGLGGEFDEHALDDKSIDDLIEKKILYPIKGLYKNTTPQIDAILISHSHKDHYGFLQYAHPAIPIYMSAGAQKLIDVLNIFVKKERRFKLSQAVKTVCDRKSFDVGDFRIMPYLVDHSTFDAMSFHVADKTSGKNIFYTGDFRAAGWKEKLFDRFVGNPPKGIDCLLMEGTMIEREAGKYPTEQAVLEKMVSVLRETENKVTFACCSGQNIDRIVTFYKAARRTKSLLVIDPYIACVLNAISSPHNHIPQMNWESVRVFIANYYGKGDVYVGKINNSTLKHLLLDLGRAKIKPMDFPSLDQKALVLMRSSMIPAIEKIPCIKGSTMVYSQWQGYLKKNNTDARRFNDFVCKYDMHLEHVHTSGHATVDKLKKFAAAINPKHIIPIHTERPQRFKEFFRDVKFLKDGERFDLIEKI